MRLIDADELFKDFEKSAWFNNADRDDVAEELLLNAPTIDAEPVVVAVTSKALVIQSIITVSTAAREWTVVSEQ